MTTASDLLQYAREAKQDFDAEVASLYLTKLPLRSLGGRLGGRLGRRPGPKLRLGRVE